MSEASLEQLLGERNTLQKMIAETPKEDVIDLGSLTVRLEEVQELIYEANTRALKETPWIDRNPLAEADILVRTASDDEMLEMLTEAYKQKDADEDAERLRQQS